MSLTETAQHAPRRVKAAILRQLAGAAHPKLEAPNLAHRFNMTIDDIKSIATAHGGIEQPARMLRAAQALEKGIEPVDAPPDADTPPASVVPEEKWASAVDPISHLLTKAAGSKKARTRNLATKIENLVGDLRRLLDDEARQVEAARRADEEKAKARAEVERLERQLREARAKLGKKPTAAPVAAVDGGPTAKDIRAWARENDVPCPATGRVPTTVRDQYAAAHQDGAA